MSGRWTTWLAWSLCGLYLALAVISQGLLVVNADPTFWESLALALVWFLFPIVGALIASRQPGTAIGWIFCALGLVTVTGDVAAQYASYALFTAAGSLPAGAFMAWLQSWPWSIQFGLLGFLLLLFPDGKLVSRRWRPVAWVTVAASTLLAVGMAFTPGPLGNHEIFHVIPNPVGLEALAGDVGQALVAVGFGLLNISILLAVMSMVVRFQRARGVERQQLKWFAVAATGLAAAFVMNFVYQFVPILHGLQEAAWLGGLAGIAIAIGIAILKHRLYDIDLLINRTIVYGGLSAGLGLAYWASVVVLQQALQPFTQGSELAIIVSTLAVAALFSPARRWIQDLVDRRFYRRKYHAERTLENFSAHLRQEVDLDSLSTELLALIRDTMQPAHVSLWLRGSAGAKL
jgi:hypothetical protein